MKKDHPLQLQSWPSEVCVYFPASLYVFSCIIVCYVLAGDDYYGGRGGGSYGQLQLLMYFFII